MTYLSKSGLGGLLAAGTLALATALPMKAQAETTYNLALLSDFSGPYADIMPILASSREVVFDWWNATSGKELGVKLNYKNYETRYDAAQVASLWPGIKSELAPIAVVGLGGPDVAALSGWRRKAFGELALQLKRGEIALSANGTDIEIVEFDD